MTFPTANERGFVLIPVIGFAAVLAITLSGFLVNLRLEVKAAANSLSNARAEYLADGITRLAALVLSKDTNEISTSWRRDGTTMTCGVRDLYALSIRIQDHAGLVDLNAASPALISDILEAAGVTGEKRAQIVDEILDFRDADDKPRVHGAEAAGYRAIGLAWTPKNAPFEDVNEIDQLPSISPEILTTLRPLLTVFSELDGVDLAVAPPVFRNMRRSAHLVPVHSQAQVYSIEVLANLKDGSQFLRRAIIKVENKGLKPFAFLAWEGGLPVAGESETAAALEIFCAFL